MSVLRTFALVVTYNRQPLLERCLAALQAQTCPPDRIVVIDNASSDGTAAWLGAAADQAQGQLLCLRMPENLGGAGGFAEAMRVAFEQGADWIWMMDDDAEPHRDALEELRRVADSPDDVYGSLAVQGADTSWLTTLLDHDGLVVDRSALVPARARVQFLPFLGFMVHRSLVARLGLPDSGYFIAADDLEYCLRARRGGARLYIAGRSRIEHPKAPIYRAGLPGRPLVCLQLPPWKRYYDTRNRLLIAREYHGFRLWTQTLPGLVVRLLACLIHEGSRTAQVRAFVAGVVDGLRGRKGRRHVAWGIRP